MCVQVGQLFFFPLSLLLLPADVVTSGTEAVYIASGAFIVDQRDLLFYYFAPSYLASSFSLLKRKESHKHTVGPFALAACFCVVKEQKERRTGRKCLTGGESSQ